MKKDELPIQPDAATAAQLEIENHIEEATDRLIASGWAAEDARSEAMRRFGSVHRIRRTMVRETHAIERRATFWDFIRSIPDDARYAWRGLLSNKLFAAVVIGTLGLGMGAAATGFTVVDALLLRPLPYANPDELVDVNVMQPDKSMVPIIPVDRAVSLAAGSPAFSGVGFTDQRTYTLTGESEAQMLSALAVSASLDEVIGVRAFLGRTFDDGDMEADAHRVMLSYDFWKKRGSDRSIIGKSIRLDGKPYDVVGVLPRNFKYPVAGTPRDLWVSLTQNEISGASALPYVYVVARLKTGMTAELANARLSALPIPLVDGKPAKGLAGLPLGVVQLGHWRGNPELVRGVWLLMGAITLMLLVAIVNAMNLILFRAADRTRELAVRIALGVSRMQLLRHVLVENVVISLLSGVTAVLIALLGVAFVNRRLPSEFAFSSAYTFAVSKRVLVFTFVLACAVGFVIGMLPAFRSLRLRVISEDLRASRGATRGDTRISQALVVAEVALAVTLLTGAGLLASSFVRLTRVDPGFDTDHLVLASLAIPESRYGTPEARADFLRRLEVSLEADPSIAAVTVSNGAPPNVSFQFGVELQAEGGNALPVAKDDPGLFPFIGAAPDFVSTTGIKLVSGRDLNSGDVGTDNVLIDSNLAHTLWGSDVTGRRFRTGPEDKWLTAVGVYHHVRAMGLDDHTSPYSMIRPRNPAKAGSYMSVIVRPRGSADAALGVFRRRLHELDGDVPAAKLQTARDAFSETVDKPRFLARVMSGISVTALILAAVGVYGVLSYAVSRRRREMGIRMALGAPPLGLGWLFLRQALIMTLSGLVVGVVAGLWLVRFAKLVLFTLQPNDPMTFSAVAVLVLAVAILASLLPAHMAGKMSPSAVLRSE